MAIKPALILEHVAGEHAGTAEAYLKSTGHPYKRIRLHDSEALPESVSELGAVMIMGGPMNVYQEEEYPFLRRENEFIKALFVNNIPTLGICLGAQLIAKAAGAKVYRAPVEEIGWHRVALTEQASKDPLFSCLPGNEIRVLQWHSDTFDLPSSSTWLMTSDSVPAQGFRYKDRFWGLQFHLEVDDGMLRDWFAKREDLPAILEEYRRYKDTLNEITRSIYRLFFGLCAQQQKS